MRVVNPWAVTLLLFVPALVLLAWLSAADSRQRLRALVAERLQSILVGAALLRRVRLGLVLGGFAFAILALARPQWGEVKREEKGMGRDIIIAVDVSRSMLANDLPPSRLRRAKLAAEDLVHQLRSGAGLPLEARATITRIGVVAFAGSAFLQAPVTSDYAAVLSAIQELDTELIPLPGTNISEALKVAMEAFDRSEGGQRAVILISDGEDLEAEGIEVAKELAPKLRIFTMGVGTPDGSVLSIPSARGGNEYIRDAQGNIVQSKLDEERLRELATVGGGFYTRLQSGPAEMRRIVLDGVFRMDRHEVQGEDKLRATERYQIPLGVALLLLGTALLLGEKTRPKAAAGLLLVFLLHPENAAAKANGRELFDAGQFPEAQTAFEQDAKNAAFSEHRSYNLGAAAYKNKRWSEAIEAFGSALASKDPELRSRAEYNFGNALVQQARQGRRGVDEKGLREALSHYDEALKWDPSLQDAAHNREAVRKMLEKKQQQQNSDDQKDQQEQQNDKHQQDQKKQQKQKSQKNQDQNQDQQDSGGDPENQDSGESGNKQKDEKGKQDPSSKTADGKQDPSKQKGEDSQPRPESEMESKERGELKDNPTAGEPKKEKPESERYQELPAGPAKLTREQAAALMEALRSEDRRVQLWVPNTQQLKESKGREGRTW